MDWSDEAIKYISQTYSDIWDFLLLFPLFLPELNFMTDVSVVLPVYNAEQWLDNCLESLYKQTFHGTIEVSAYNDGSQDGSQKTLEKWQKKLESRNIVFLIENAKAGHTKGVGYARNRAVEGSHGRYVCFLDADDVMDNKRIDMQYEAAENHPEALIGSCFHRHPEGSTDRYTYWVNHLTENQLYVQAYTSHGPTIAMPTWFCSREVFQKVGGFCEDGKGTPEDLLFFYKHLDLGGTLYRVDADLMMYRYHPQCTTFSVPRKTIWNLRVMQIQKDVIDGWKSFTIWNAGKQGRHFYRSLSLSNKRKVTEFCDVDKKKIDKGVYIYEESQTTPKPKIPIVHYTKASPPFIICVKMDLTGGAFEENLASLHLAEGVDYYHFS